jgi:nicotinamide mononucleotide transporter
MKKTSIFGHWYWFDYVLYGSCFVILLVVSLIFSASPLSIVMALLGISAGMLNTKTSRFCFPVYTITVLLYAFISYRNKIYGEAIMNLFYLFPLYAISSAKLFQKQSEEQLEFHVHQGTKKQYLIFTGVAIAITVIYGTILYFLKSKFAYVNAFAIGLSVAASYFSSKHIYAHWYLWTANNIILIALWFITLQESSSDALPILIEDIVFTILNIYGLISWNKILKKQKENEEKNETSIGNTKRIS